MKHTLAFLLLFVLSLSASLRSNAQAGNPPAPDQPRVVNAKVETRAVQGPLESGFCALVSHTQAPAWVGYSVPEVAGDRTACCGDFMNDDSSFRCERCRLEGRNDEGVSINSNDRQRVELEGSNRVSILFRVQDSAVGRIRVVSENCELDAGGLPFIWLTGVRPAESVALLAGYVTGTNAEGRGKAGLAVLKTMAHSDPSDNVRAHVPFALSVSREPAALEEMIRMAREDSSAHVRGQALFWLAQKAGKKAASTITDAIENDPNTEVKKKAVFALSQLPKDDGVPKLIEVARNNRNPAVRKQAMFWLGQSNDPRALAFFEEVLSH